MITQVIISKLFEFQNNASLEIFRTIFGWAGDHMWEKYQKAQQNFLLFYCGLDRQSKALIVFYLNGGR